MKPVRKLLCPQRARQLPAQFSWVDQALVQQHFIDRCDARAAALYLFLVTVADAQGLSYYGTSTLAARLHLREDEFAAARQQLITLELIAYCAPLYQVLALPGTVAAPRSVSHLPRSVQHSPRSVPDSPRPVPHPYPQRADTVGGAPVSLASLLQQLEQQLEQRRGGL